jgi:hypothetical protein
MTKLISLLSGLPEVMTEGVSLLSKLPNGMIKLIFLSSELSDDLVLFMFLLKGFFKFFISIFHNFISFVYILPHFVDDFLFSSQMRVQVLVITL